MKARAKRQAAEERFRVAVAGIDLQFIAPRPWVSVGAAFLTGFVCTYFPKLRTMLPGAIFGFVSKALAASVEPRRGYEPRPRE